MPKRIQRQRTKGWRMPPNAIYVGRPSMWGNPFKGYCSPEQAVKLFRHAMDSCWSGPYVYELLGENDSLAHADWQAWRPWFTSAGGPRTVARDLLRGKDLACWCPLDQPCHADVLLEIANE